MCVLRLYLYMRIALHEAAEYNILRYLHFKLICSIVQVNLSNELPIPAVYNVHVTLY